MIIGQALFGLLVIAGIFTLIGILVQAHQQKQDYKKYGRKFESYKAFCERYYSRYI